MLRIQQVVAIPNQSSSAAFHYTPNRDRWKQVASYGGTSETTRYIGDLLEIVTRGTLTEYRHQIPLGASATAIQVRGTGYGWTFYVTKDHLGSGSLMMGDGGVVLANLSLGSFGERRKTAWHDEPTY